MLIKRSFIFSSHQGDDYLQAEFSVYVPDKDGLDSHDGIQQFSLKKAEVSGSLQGSVAFGS